MSHYFNFYNLLFGRIIMKMFPVIGLITTLMITSCAGLEEMRQREAREYAREQAQREENTKVFCAGWSQVRPGMTYHEVNRYVKLGFDSSVICGSGRAGNINLGHVMVEFDRDCHLVRATTKVACENPVIQFSFNSSISSPNDIPARPERA
jgi:hypothetical protein